MRPERLARERVPRWLEVPSRRWSKPLLRVSRAAASGLLIFSLAAECASPALAAAPPLTRADYESCQAGDEASFRRSVEAISIRALESGTKSIDYTAAVADAWRRENLDDILDKRVDIAVAEVRAETSWSGLAKSLVSKEKAQELAKEVAERVYRSDAVKAAIEGLATSVGKEIGKSIELASQDATGPALECLRAFLGPRYGATVASVVTGDAEREFGIVPGSGGAEITSGAVLKQSGEGITGAAILLVRRQLANMAARIGQRLAGSILARLVSVVAGGIGLVLIAKDIWELRNGVLPIIAEEMKSKETKEKVKEELAKGISEQIGEHLHEIAAKSAERIVAIWQEFRRAHVQVLDLAERHPPFRTFLDGTKPEQLARLDEVTALVIGAEGEAGVLHRLEDGSLNEAVRILSEPAMDIARATRSIDTAMRWSDLSAGKLNLVLEYEIYRRAKPDDFTKSSLSRLLALDDGLAVTRLASVSREARERLFDLDAGELKRLARSLTEAELTTLASYLTGLEQGPRERVLRTVANAPARMQVLASARVRDAVIASPDQSAAVEMMLRESGAGIESAVADVRAAWDGRIAPVLIWEKHPLLVGAALAAALLVLLLMRRLFFTRRPRLA
jgi:hypothetical protein